MFGVLIRPSFRSFAGLAIKRIQNRTTSELARNFTQLSIQPAKPLMFKHSTIKNLPPCISSHPEFLKISANPTFTPARTVTKFSMKLGKRKSVKAALKRFKRLDWGIWIRTRSARHKRLWRKSGNQRRKLRQHVFTNSTQSYMLDKMVTTFWRRPKHYVDDPYEPYHKRETYWSMRKKPIEWN